MGAGSWGTALAMQLARAGATRLWGRDALQLDTMVAERENTRYLPGVRFPDALEPSADLRVACDGVRDVVIAVPSHAFRETLERIASHLRPDARVAYAVKGFEPGTGTLPHAVVRDVLGGEVPTAVLSGPTFAAEVAANLPTAIVAATTDADFAATLTRALHHGRFRTYTTDDVTGVEVGGAVKNVLAIAAGLSDGLGFGANARAALITRGLSEIVRLGVALGGRQETFLGLAGVGDLVLTCTDDQSRNRRFGLALGGGADRAAAEREIRQVVEGISAAAETVRLAARLDIEMPIAVQVDAVANRGLSPRDAFRALMAREPKAE
ncbi:MAG: NAD(P)H-dependent glycerol-3-phosphate dehydrogenase [Gammaproteobacteria bacterium]